MKALRVYKTNYLEHYLIKLIHGKKIFSRTQTKIDYSIRRGCFLSLNELEIIEAIIELLNIYIIIILTRNNILVV